MRFIGDVHGKINEYTSVINGASESVQVGDMGFGFLSVVEHDHVNNHIFNNVRHKFIRGNHDDPEQCKASPGYIPDGTFDAERGIMYVGGAWSIDWRYRTPGYSWWCDEEVDDISFSQIEAEYLHFRPNIMVTHDCPTLVSWEMFLSGSGNNQYKTRTGEFFDSMFHHHQTDIWVFGHWHEDKEAYINGTRFICLNELSYIDLEV